MHVLIDKICRYWEAVCRGVNALCACPSCLCPSAEQSDLTKSWPLRTQDSGQQVYYQCQELLERGLKSKAEKILKSLGLYYIKVC